MKIDTARRVGWGLSGTVANIPDGVMGVGMASGSQDGTGVDHYCALGHGTVAAMSGVAWLIGGVAYADGQDTGGLNTAAFTLVVSEGAKAGGYAVAHAGACPTLAAAMLITGCGVQALGTGLAASVT